MLKIGLTGGIGSGKSTVCRFFSLLGIPCYDSDARAKALMDTDPVLRAQIEALLGPTAYTPRGVDRPYVASRIFGDAVLLGQLNGMVHPAVARDFLRWASEQQAPYVIGESAILFESRADQYLDKTVVLLAPEALRIARAVRRDGVDPERVRARIAHQMSDPERARRADYCLQADERQLLIPQILALHQTLLALCN